MPDIRIPRHPHKAYRLLEMLRRIRNPADAERIEELRSEISAYWERYFATAKGRAEIREFARPYVAKLRRQGLHCVGCSSLIPIPDNFTIGDPLVCLCEVRPYDAKTHKASAAGAEKARLDACRLPEGVAHA